MHADEVRQSQLRFEKDKRGEQDCMVKSISMGLEAEGGLVAGPGREGGSG